MVRAVLLDLDNTLLSFDQYVKETMKIGFKKFNIGIYSDEMFSVFDQINTDLWRSIERGEIDFRELQKKRWNLIFERLNISYDGEAFEKYFRECLFESAIPENGALELLEYLKSKYILCVASNGPYLQQKNRLKKAGMLDYFSELFVSEEIGSSKPSEKFFSACVDLLNLKTEQKIRPCEIMVIGDSLSSDMAGGIRAGMQTCFYNPSKRPIPSEMKIDHSVTSLREIENIL